MFEGVQQGLTDQLDELRKATAGAAAKANVVPLDTRRKTGTENANG